MFKKICFFTLLFTGGQPLLCAYRHSYFNDTDGDVSVTAIYASDAGGEEPLLGPLGEKRLVCTRNYINLSPGQKSNDLKIGSCLIQEVIVAGEHGWRIATEQTKANRPGYYRTLDELVSRGIKFGRWRSWRNLGQNKATNKTFKITKDASGNFDLKQ